MNASNSDIISGITIAAITALSIAMVLWIGKAVGRWLTRSMAHTFAEQVVEVMAPDMARMGTRLGQSIDELRVANTIKHRADQARLTQVELRLERVESALGIRPPDARTRSTDQEE